MPATRAIADQFAHVDVWIFDLDNTLYPAEIRLFDQIQLRMTAWVARELGLDDAAADSLRTRYWREHGTTLAGLMAEHAIDPRPYLSDVHDIDFSVLPADPGLAAAIDALPGRKIVHTNADAAYAGKVLARRGLTCFEAVCGIEEVGFHPKPDPRSFAAVLALQGIDPRRAAMFEDDPRNLIVPHSLGMRTILVGAGRHGPDELAADHVHGTHVDHRTHDLAGFLAPLAPAGPNVAS
ncbi:pyrimidine 5'-nucleotidase [uncultured Paracoccus sp.]|uniref:pyrimidine 5'-nucleotidase n=1 Tax=uncultured Paracoccus sp. TaxID=189685 RepID=UPI002625A60D|nr:pyrimidine 5'-nucleotidase [uncultured Paracoccus sp.]